MGTDVKEIPRLYQCFYGTYASLPIGGLNGNPLGFATDRLVLYRWNGASWDPLTFYCSSGPDASKPTAADLPNGSVYFADDTIKLYQVQAGAWVDISATWVPPSKGLFIKTETRDMTAASGDVSYTGYGFEPSGLIIFAQEGSRGSIGIADPAKAVKTWALAAGLGWGCRTTCLIFTGGDTSNKQEAYVVSYNADGFTLTWVKTGSPTGTAGLGVLALKN